jgi:hypothetical protein
MKLLMRRRGRRKWWLGLGVLVSRLLSEEGKLVNARAGGFEVLR